jgi:hypothetical protein
MWQLTGKNPLLEILPNANSQLLLEPAIYIKPFQGKLAGETG